MAIFADLSESRELLYNLTMREVKGKYKRTALGQLWSLANPLAQMVIYSFVFQFVIRVQPDAGDPSGLNIFALWLMCGILPWSFFTNVVNGGMGALVGNENLIKKVYFPRSALLVSNSLSWLYNWAMEMAVLVVAIAILGGRPWLWIVPTLLLMGLLALFATGAAMMMSMANVYFRDTQYLVGILFQLWFYANPIVYPASMVAAQSDKIGPFLGVTVMELYKLNPFYYYIMAFRNLLYDNRLPDPSTIGIVVVLSVSVFLIGWRLFDRHQPRLAEVL
ncbi:MULTISPECIES: ABC transporter permease [Actinomyces]|uniref:Transport permease protein n=1 Tax=Actinomyces glycerinitolerans TaxID=1892869 RepID=A0A1M4RVJ2_9ACTO|nr:MULTISPECIES: ABC transporter permease [Actinomyces]RAX20515.1 ABC transporter permease [Actinomyces sp. Z5]RAX21242.1 ABC transporter permease [Actinomyces sp. Z3]SHE24005.1 abc-2 type transporter [Actinomyces glycerinitolerans]